VRDYETGKVYQHRDEMAFRGFLVYGGKTGYIWAVYICERAVRDWAFETVKEAGMLLD